MRSELKVLLGVLSRWRGIGNRMESRSSKCEFDLRFEALLQIAFILIFMGFSQVPARAADIEVALRMDDSGFGRHGAVAGAVLTDAEITRHVIEIISKHNAKISIGVIPNVVTGSPGYKPRNPEFRLLSACQEELTVLRDATKNKDVELCLHGWTHEALTRHRGWISEFGGETLEAQTARLKWGREELEHSLGIPIDVFIPPFDNHDCVTLQALQALRFRAISSGAQSTDDVEGLRYVPNTTPLTELQDAVAMASQSSEPVFIMALFHGYDFTESGYPEAYIGLDQFERLLRELAGNPRVGFTTIAGAGRLANHPFDATECRLYAGLRDRITRVTDIAKVMGPLGAAVRARIPSAKMIPPDEIMRRASSLLFAFEAMVELFLFIGTAVVGSVLLRYVRRAHWGRQVTRTALIASGTCLLLAVLKGAVGILGAPGFGSRLVMLMSCAGALLLVTLTQRRAHAVGGAAKTQRDFFAYLWRKERVLLTPRGRRTTPYG